MCHHLGYPIAYKRIRRGVAAVTREQADLLTPDLGGKGTTEGLTEAIMAAVQAQPAVA